MAVFIYTIVSTQMMVGDAEFIDWQTLDSVEVTFDTRNNVNKITNAGDAWKIVYENKETVNYWPLRIKLLSDSFGFQNNAISEMLIEVHIDKITDELDLFYCFEVDDNYVSMVNDFDGSLGWVGTGKSGFYHYPQAAQSLASGNAAVLLDDVEAPSISGGYDIRQALAGGDNNNWVSLENGAYNMDASPVIFLFRNNKINDTLTVIFQGRSFQLSSSFTHNKNFNIWISPDTSGTIPETVKIKNVIVTMTHFTSKPTLNPTINPTSNPTTKPTQRPTDNPTIKSTINPTVSPTITTIAPAFIPTFNPTSNPTFNPTSNPTFNPIPNPTFNPTRNSSVDPTKILTFTLTIDPTSMPTFSPTNAPKTSPTFVASNKPTKYSTSAPVILIIGCCSCFCILFCFMKMKKIDDKKKTKNAMREFKHCAKRRQFSAERKAQKQMQIVQLQISEDESKVNHAEIDVLPEESPKRIGEDTYDVMSMISIKTTNEGSDHEDNQYESDENEQIERIETIEGVAEDGQNNIATLKSILDKVAVHFKKDESDREQIETDSERENSLDDIFVKEDKEDGNDPMYNKQDENFGVIVFETTKYKENNKEDPPNASDLKHWETLLNDDDMNIVKNSDTEN